MSITSVLSTDDNLLTIAIKGRFDFASHQSFCDAYEGVGNDIDQYLIDMRDVSYLDSSALGMLLLLKDHAKDGAKIGITHCSDDVRKIFEISNFKQLFDID